MLPSKLCPMGFANDLNRSNSLCLGVLCGWFDEESGACAISVLAGKASGRSAKTAKKKPAEE